jgi:hypothetical protein
LEKVGEGWSRLIKFEEGWGRMLEKVGYRKKVG